MFNFRITFAHPWLWLLLIPAVGCALFLHFRSAKKFRRTRNRIISLCLHLAVVLLCTATLVNTKFDYEVYNNNNEIIFLVDASDSNETSKNAKDEYLYNAIAMVDSKAFKVGVVTFGFDQKYSVPITTDASSVYERYINSELPDTSATDIAAALEYAKTLFANPETAKIVLITDGYETDESALSVVRAIAGEGIRIDVIGTDKLVATGDAEITDAEFPDYNVEVGEEFEIKLKINSVLPESRKITITVTDNGESTTEEPLDLISGENTFAIKHKITETGLHSFKFEISTDKDTEQRNNSLVSYMYVEKFDKVLVIESYEGQSEEIKKLMPDYELTVYTIDDAELPVTADALREYDEVILNNISNSDLQKRAGLDEALERYVKVYGGAMFTVGGNEQEKDEDGKSKAHAYNRKDLAGSLYQNMLPVEAIDYTPPLGLYIIIDVSGSMTGTSQGEAVSKKEAACDTALSIVKDDTCLSERDYCGIMTLSDDYAAETPKPLSMLRQAELRGAIARIRADTKSGGTMFGPAINGASQQLFALKSANVIEKMHIIVVTDGAAGDFAAQGDTKSYKTVAEEWAAKGVTISFVGVDAAQQDIENMQSVADSCNEIAKDTVGKVYNSGWESLTQDIKKDIRVPEIKEVAEKDFTPAFVSTDTVYSKIISQDEMPTLGGFYGVKARTGTTVLTGEYNVPIYSEWKYGKGTVGSFMSDLQGNWSKKFLDDVNGQKLLLGIINKLMPTTSIRAPELTVTLKEENYITQVSVVPSSELGDGETIGISVQNIDVPSAEIEVTQPSAENSFTRGTFIAKVGGIYRIVATRYAADGSVIATKEQYKAFSYSEEYSLSEKDFDSDEFLNEVAARGNGTSQKVTTANPASVLDGFVQSIKKTYDPTILFMILTIVFFLADIAVRKFKFKWIHEIIKERKEKR